MKSFFVNVLTEEALVTEVSSNAGISDWRIVWVKSDCWFMSDMLKIFLLFLSYVIALKPGLLLVSLAPPFKSVIFRAYYYRD
jgi:hypothetical protein